MPDWQAIVREHGPLVWRTAYRLLNHDADAADCLQRTFLSALNVAAAGPVRNWRALLKRLTISRALERLRERYRQSGRAETIPEAMVADGMAADPPDAASAGELADALRIALTGIDPTQAEVFCLVVLNDFSYREAADYVGLTANHVGVLLTRAKAELRERLRAFDPTPERLLGGAS